MLKIRIYYPRDWKCNICLFIWGFTSHSRMSHSYGDVMITGEGRQILTYVRHSWPLSSEGLKGNVSISSLEKIRH